MLLDGQRSDLDEMLEEPVREHSAQHPPYLVIKGSQAHLPRLDRLQQLLTEELRAGHFLV